MQHVPVSTPARTSTLVERCRSTIQYAGAVAVRLQSSVVTGWRLPLTGRKLLRLPSVLDCQVALRQAASPPKKVGGSEG